jgi:predicted phosphodiesterase
MFAVVFLSTGAYFLFKSSAATPSIKGDLNVDGVVNILDLSIMLTNYAKPQSQSTNTYTDLNSDGNVDVLDLSSLLTNYGKTSAPIDTTTTTIWAVGDGANSQSAPRVLGNYIASNNPDAFFYLGDVYQNGTETEFTTNYTQTYGQLNSKTQPVIGNHESANRSSGYLPYWANSRSWSAETAKHRSYVDKTGWQIIAYSSEENMTTEASWVTSQRNLYPSGTCRIFMSHRGRYVANDTVHGDNTDQAGVWTAMKGFSVLNLVGHNHLFARLAPIDGITVIVSGAGGNDMRPLASSQTHTIVASKTNVPTATKLVLKRGSVTFSQVDSTGRVYDSGSLTCTPVN